MFLKKSSPTQQEFSSPKAYFGFNLDPSCNFPGIAVSLQTTCCCSGALGGFPAPLLPHTGERREDPARASHTCPNPGSPFILTTELCMSAEKENLCSCTETSPSSSSEKKKKKPTWHSTRLHGKCASGAGTGRRRQLIRQLLP